MFYKHMLNVCFIFLILFFCCCCCKFNPVWNEYKFFGRMNIRIYSLPYILDEWISEYIRHDKNITNENPNKFSNEKINEYFCEWIYLSKIFECIRISDYVPNIILDYFGHFHMLCYFVPILNHFGPIIIFLTIFGKIQWKFKYIRYHRYWTNEYPNIFVSINRWQINIRIYSPWKKLTNIWTNEYIRLNILEYIRISEYLSHTDPILQWFFVRL